MTDFGSPVNLNKAVKRAFSWMAGQYKALSLRTKSINMPNQLANIEGKHFDPTRAMLPGGEQGTKKSFAASVVYSTGHGLGNRGWDLRKVINKGTAYQRLNRDLPVPSPVQKTVNAMTPEAKEIIVKEVNDIGKINKKISQSIRGIPFPKHQYMTVDKINTQNIGSLYSKRMTYDMIGTSKPVKPGIHHIPKSADRKIKDFYRELPNPQSTFKMEPHLYRGTSTTPDPYTISGTVKNQYINRTIVPDPSRPLQTMNPGDKNLTLKIREHVTGEYNGGTRAHDKFGRGKVEDRMIPIRKSLEASLIAI